MYVYLSSALNRRRVPNNKIGLPDSGFFLFSEKNLDETRIISSILKIFKFFLGNRIEVDTVINHVRRN